MNVIPNRLSLSLSLFSAVPRQLGRLRLLIAAMAACTAIFNLAVDGSASAQSPRYRIIVIESPTGVTTIESINGDYMGINNKGEATGTLIVNGSQLPFVWLPAANPNYQDLSSAGTHSLPLDPERTTHLAREINVDGVVVGRAFLSEIGTSAYHWNLQTGTEGVIHLFTFQHKDEAIDINDADPPVIVGGAFVPPDSLTHGYRKILYTDNPEVLEFLLPSHNGSRAHAISDSGFVAGRSIGQPPTPEPDCGEEQDHSRAVSWVEDLVVPESLNTLGTPIAEAVTIPIDVNNASPSMIVGVGDDPNDILVPCRDRGLFWADEFSEPIALPYLSGFTPDPAMRADAIADPYPDGRLEAVGRSEGANAAVLWRRVNGVWEAIDLNDVISCGGEAWANVIHALDINDCGWIVGHGTLTNGSPRAFILVPASSCAGDISGGTVTYPNGKVDIDDLLTVVNAWGSTTNCVVDITGDGVVNIDDLLAVINTWGACSCFPSQTAPPSLSQTLTNVGLNMSDWNEFVSVMASGAQSDKDNYNCWMQRHLSECVRCPSCPGSDPFAN